MLAPEQGCGWRREPLGSSEPPCGTAGLAWRSGSAAAGSRDRAGRTARRGDLLAAAGGLQPQGLLSLAGMLLWGLRWVSAPAESSRSGWALAPFWASRASCSRRLRPLLRGWGGVFPLLSAASPTFPVALTPRDEKSRSVVSFLQTAQDVTDYCLHPSLSASVQGSSPLSLLLLGRFSCPSDILASCF